jgi:predicted nucleic acid-binding protein
MKTTIDIPDELLRLAKARDRSIEPVMRSANEIVIPVIVLGGFEYGIRQSRHYRRYADWVDASLDSVEIAMIDREVAHAYGAVRLELKKAGTLIPINDAWIAAIAPEATA